MRINLGHFHTNEDNKSSETRMDLLLEGEVLISLFYQWNNWIPSDFWFFQRSLNEANIFHQGKKERAVKTKQKLVKRIYN